mmetsp:Transcript_10199/g.16403  ORF Transcript_10199/g.16403 Transcript_10199/m.16403 type:complete len:226 (+) Transcript_10199:69-746(+)
MLCPRTLRLQFITIEFIHREKPCSNLSISKEPAIKIFECFCCSIDGAENYENAHCLFLFDTKTINLGDTTLEHRAIFLAFLCGLICQVIIYFSRPHHVREKDNPRRFRIVACYSSIAFCRCYNRHPSVLRHTDTAHVCLFSRFYTVCTCLLLLILFAKFFSRLFVPSFTFFSLKFFLSHLHKLLVIIRLGRVILIEDLITKWPLFTVYTLSLLVRCVIGGVHVHY